MKDLLEGQLVTVGELAKQLLIDPDDILSLVRLGAMVSPIDWNDSGTWEDCCWVRGTVDKVIIPCMMRYLVARWTCLEKAIKDNCTIHIHGHDMVQEWAKEALEGHRKAEDEYLVSLWCKFEPKRQLWDN